MKRKKKKTEYLTYIEDTTKHHPRLVRVAQKATKLAIEEALENDIPIMYIRDGQIVREYPDGTIEIVGEVEGNRRIVVKGEQYTLSEG